MFASEKPAVTTRGVLLPLLLSLSACSAHHSGASTEQTSRPEPSIQPVATLQDLMQAEVDASADDIWDAVETTSSNSGEVIKQPRNPREWQEIRRKAIVLIEAANLLTVERRKLSAAPFPAEAVGALDSAEIERRIATHRVVFNQYAAALRQAAQTVLTAIDAQDSKALVTAGGALDEVCESCHMTFWYPNQVIPAFPTPGDPRYARIAVNPSR
jgi:cytochrome c556